MTTARRINKSLGDLTGLTGFGFHIIEVEPGCESTELPMHHHEDECVYILSGGARGDDRPGGAAHRLWNTGGQSLRCIVVGQRRDHDVADYPLKRRRIYRNKAMKWDVVDFDAIAEPDAGNK